MKRFSSLAISVAAMGLFVAPVKAQTGNVQGMNLDTVVCFNRTTGETAPGTLVSVNDTGEFSCDRVGEGEIGILLIGAGGPPPPCDTEVDREPNDSRQQAQDIGILSGSEACSLTVTGNIHTGYDDFDNPNPNADYDVYALALEGVSQLRFEIQMALTSQYAYGIKDADTNEFLQCQPEPMGAVCVVPAQSTRVFVAVSTQSPNDYTLTLRGEDGGGNQPFGAFAYGTRGFNGRQLRSIH